MLYINQSDDGTVHFSIKEYLGTIKPLVATRERRKEFDSLCTAAELTAYQGLAGSLNFLGHGVLPQASFAASFMQQAVRPLKVSILITANKLLLEINKLEANITFRPPNNLGVTPSYLAFSDASHGSTPFGQTGYVSSMYLPAGSGGLYHVIDWLSCKQTCVVFSSIGDEILAAETFSGRESMISERLKVVFSAEHPLPFVLTVDSHGLFSTAKTLDEGSEYRLRPTVARMRDSLETGEISVKQWIAGNGILQTT